MSTTINVSKQDIGEVAFDIANLIGLLNESGDLQTDWFTNPATQLEAAPGRAKSLIQTIQAFLGPQSDINAPVFSGAEWRQAPNPSTGNPTPLYIVTPAATDAGGLMGVGFEHSISVGNLTIIFYVFVPLFDINNGANPDFVLVNSTASKVSPIKVGVDISSTNPIDPGDGSGEFTDFILEGDISLDGSASDLFSLNIEFKNNDATVAQYSNLTDFINDSATENRIGAVITQGMAYWLNLIIGTSGQTVGDVMVKAKLLTQKTQNNFSYYAYDPNLLKELSTEPLTAAEDIGFAVLSVLADNEAPLIPLPFLTPKAEGSESSENAEGDGAAAGGEGAAEEGGGESGGGGEGDDSDAPVAGIWIAFDPKNPGDTASEDGSYGVRLMIPDIPISLGSGKTSPTLHLRLGSWFTGEESDEDGWVNAIVKGEDALKLGLSIFFLDYATGGNISFSPSFELTSVGFDVVGAKDTPLFNVGGVTMNGVELRAYINQNDDWQYGFGARVDDVGIPLGSSFTKGVTDGGGNPVAKNIVTSGDNAQGESGGDAAEGKTDAVNPSFSLEAAYVSGTVGAAENWFVQLLPPNGAAGDIVWFPVNRKFGPIECQKVGLSWNQANLLLDIVLDGGISLSGMTAELIELSVGIPLNDPTTISDYELGLKGLDVSYIGSGIEIQGAFLKSGSGDTVEYDGLASIKVADLGVGALGSYSSLPNNGGTSLFIFAWLDAPLGGVPAFFVTGLAAGFGYNRSFVPPAYDKVADFPLVLGMSDPAALGVTPGQQPDLATVLQTFDTAVPPTRGEYWLAAGVMFTSFELIKSNVLAAVEFGNNFEIMILGTSTVKLPQVSSITMAFAELEIEVVIAPSEGVIEASAVLAPSSFVLDPACHLTGGFAFYLWFGSNEHSGDFVLTIGGYNNSFQKPEWYPDIPRLGFNWKVSDLIEIAGGAYFALTPSCIMAGGSLKLLMNAGPLKAWFDAHADMLISWKPFWYDISVGVTVGVSVKVDLLFVKGTVKVEIGADVEVWGPPTGAKCHVHLWIVSFTISFGPSKSSIDTVTDWSGFQEMLPGGDSGGGEQQQQNLAKGLHGALHGGGGGGGSSDATVCSISYVSGVTDTLTTGPDTGAWVVNPADFSFNIQTTAPVTSGTLKTTTDGPAADLDLDLQQGYFVGARPMGIDDIQTPLTLTITGDNDADWEYTVLKQDVPEAMWGKALPPGGTPSASSNLLSDRVMGLTNVEPEKHVPEGPPVIDMKTAFTDVPVTQYPEQLPFAHIPIPQGAVPAAADSFPDLKKIMQDPAQSERAALFDAFQMLGVWAGPNAGDLTEMAGDPYYAYRDAPMEGAPLAS